MTEPILIDPCMQKDIADCGVACLKMLTGLSYEQVHAAFSKRAKVASTGMSNRQVLLAAKKLGFPLRYIKDGDLYDMVGMVNLIRCSDPSRPKKGNEGHLAILVKGVIYNPADGMLWTDIETFFKVRRWQPLGVFVRV